jgi:hypothetical protein
MAFNATRIRAMPTAHWLMKTMVDGFFVMVLWMGRAWLCDSGDTGILVNGIGTHLTCTVR